MNVQLLRTYLEKETVGEFRVLDDDNQLIYRCHTVELPDRQNQVGVSCIPEGTYSVQKEKPNKHFNYVHFSVLNVPGRSGILIHIANYVSQLKGCIAPGRDLIDMNGDRLPDVNYSNVVMKDLANLLPDRFSLTIKRKDNGIV